MPIVTPGKRPAKRFERSKVLGGRLLLGRKSTNADLNVIPMVDMMTLLVTLAMGERGFNLSTSAGSSVDIPTLGRDGEGRVLFDLKALGDRLKQLKGDHPDTSSITVQAEDTVSYGDLVQVIDAAVGAGLPAVSVTG